MKHIGNSSNGVIIEFSKEELAKLHDVFGRHGCDDYNGIMTITNLINMSYAVFKDLEDFTGLVGYASEKSTRLNELLEKKEFPMGKGLQ